MEEPPQAPGLGRWANFQAVFAFWRAPVMAGVATGGIAWLLTRTRFVIARSKATRQSRWLAGNSSFGEIAALRSQ